MNKCPNCGSIKTEQKLTSEKGMELPIRYCIVCNEEWENEDTFRARAEALADQMKRRGNQ